MEQFTDAGNGVYTYIDTLDEAQTVCVDNLIGTLQLISDRLIRSLISWSAGLCGSIGAIMHAAPCD